MHYEFQIVSTDAQEPVVGPILAERLRDLFAHRHQAERAPEDHDLRVPEDAADGDLLFVATISVVEDEDRAVFREERIRVFHKDGESSLAWHTRNDADMPTEQPVRACIMADYGMAWAWDEAGVGTNLSALFPDIVGVPELEKEFDQWQGSFESHLPNDSGYVTEIDWPKFHEQGRRLAYRLKKLVGDRGEVFYWKPFEDANTFQDLTHIHDDVCMPKFPTPAPSGEVDQLAVHVFLAEHAYPNSGETYFIAVRIQVNGQLLTERWPTDLHNLTKSCLIPGGFDLMTCECGEPGCASIWEPVIVEHDTDSTTWHVPDPISWDGVPDYMQLEDDEDVRRVTYRFDRCQYVAAIADGLRRAKGMLFGPQARIEPTPHGTTPEGVLALDPRAFVLGDDGCIERFKCRKVRVSWDGSYLYVGGMHFSWHELPLPADWAREFRELRPRNSRHLARHLARYLATLMPTDGVIEITDDWRWFELTTGGQVKFSEVHRGQCRTGA